MNGGGSAVEPPYIRPLQREGTSPTQLIIALMEVGTSPTLRSRHLGGPASHLSFNPRPQAGGANSLFVNEPSHSSSFRRTPLIQLYTLRRFKLDPGFRRGDE